MSDERDTAEIIQEIRRQGRAAVAAQAAAEACLVDRGASRARRRRSECR